MMKRKKLKHNPPFPHPLFPQQATLHPSPPNKQMTCPKKTNKKTTTKMNMKESNKHKRIQERKTQKNDKGERNS
jgi:hypothetical protein